MFWTLLAIILCVCCVYYRWQRRRIHAVAKMIPMAVEKSYPLIGHAYLFKGNSEDHIKTLNKLGQGAIDSGGLLSFWMANKLYVNVADPEVAEVILKSCLDKDQTFANFSRPYLGNGSIFAPVNIWRPRRKILSRIFSVKNLNSYVPEFEKQATIMTKLLEQMVDKGDISLWNYINTYTFDTICKNCLGVDINSQMDNFHPFVESSVTMARVICERMMRPWMYIEFIFEQLPLYKEILDASKSAHEFVHELIRKKREENVKCDPDSSATSENPTFLDMLIESSGGPKGYTDLELREETLVIILAGSDTSAVGASFTAVMLSKYPEIQEKVYQELQRVLGNSNRAITAAGLSNMVYLEAVIKETLRFYPAIPVYVREVYNDIQIPSGVTLVDGVGVVLNLYGMHRNPKYWGEDAEFFRPERFLEGPLKHPVQFIPFSYSIRNCVGATYAMMAMKTVLAMMLLKYRLLPPAGLDPKDWKKPLRVQIGIMLRDTDNYTVRLEKRNEHL